MGGIGSGSIARRSEPLVEELFPISAKTLRLEGVLGQDFGLILSLPDKTPYYVSMVGNQDGVTLTYHLDDDSVTQRVNYSIQSRPLGGFQYYLKCPVCEKQREALYIHQTVACRACHNAVHTSENLGRLERARRSRSQMAAKLGCRPDDVLPEKPPFMHWPTYERHCFRLSESQVLLARLERERFKAWEKVARRTIT